jgi:hypothetical protein
VIDVLATTKFATSVSMTWKRRYRLEQSGLRRRGKQARQRYNDNTARIPADKRPFPGFRAALQLTVDAG